MVDETQFLLVARVDPDLTVGVEWGQGIFKERVEMGREDFFRDIVN